MKKHKHPKPDLPSVKGGEPITLPLPSVYYVGCCDCGLVHLLVVRKRGENEVELKLYRDDWMTEQIRKRKKGR